MTPEERAKKIVLDSITDSGCRVHPGVTEKEIAKSIREAVDDERKATMTLKEYVEEWCRRFPIGIPDEADAQKFCDEHKGKRIGDWMPCGHHLQCWRPLEGTITGRLQFEKDPEQYGFCQICYAVNEERKSIVIMIKQIRKDHPKLYGGVYVCDYMNACADIIEAIQKVTHDRGVDQ